MPTKRGVAVEPRPLDSYPEFQALPLNAQEFIRTLLGFRDFATAAKAAGSSCSNRGDLLAVGNDLANQPDIAEVLTLVGWEDPDFAAARHEATGAESERRSRKRVEVGKITNLDKARAMKALKPHHRAFVKALLAGQSLSECARIAGSRASNPAVACVMRNRPDIAKVLKLSGYKKPEKKPKATGGAPQARVSAKSTEPPAEPATSPADPPEPHSGGLDEKLIRAEAEQLSAFAEWLNGEIVGWNTAEEARA